MTEPEARSVARSRLKVAREHLEHVRAKESAAHVERAQAIEHARKAGLRTGEIAEALGVSRQWVHLIGRG